MRAIAQSVLSVGRSGPALPRPCPDQPIGRQGVPSGALPHPQPLVASMPASLRQPKPRRVAGPSGILLVTPQALVRHGVAMTLAAQHPDARIVEAGSPREAGELLRRGERVDLIVLDLDPSAADEAPAGDEERRTGAIRQLARHGIPVVVVASACHPGAVLASVRAGAHAYVAKTGSSSILEHAVALARFGAQSGERYIPLPRSALERPPATEPVETEGIALARLSQRQREIFRLLVAGGSNKAIARELGVLEGTVKVHVRAVMQKLGVRNRTQIAVVAARHGSPQDPDPAVARKADSAGRAIPAPLGTAKNGGR